jgi:hypothetical protein
MTHENRRKVNKFHFFKYWMSLLRAEGFCSLDVLNGALGIAIFEKKSKKKFSRIFFFNCAHQNPGSVLNPDPDPYPYPDSLEMSGSIPTTLETRLFLVRIRIS